MSPAIKGSSRQRALSSTLLSALGRAHKDNPFKSHQMTRRSQGRATGVWGLVYQRQEEPEIGQNLPGRARWARCSVVRYLGVRKHAMQTAMSDPKRSPIRFWLVLGGNENASLGPGNVHRGQKYRGDARLRLWHRPWAFWGKAPTSMATRAWRRTVWRYRLWVAYAVE